MYTKRQDALSRGTFARNINSPRSFGYRISNKAERAAWFEGYDAEDIRINSVNDGNKSAFMACYTPGASPKTHAGTTLNLTTISMVADTMTVSQGVWQASGNIWIVPGTCEDDPVYMATKYRNDHHHIWGWYMGRYWLPNNPPEL